MSTEETEKRFIRMPSESIRLCAERIGIQTSTEVSNALVEDVSFRIRQITDIAIQLMRRAKRRRLTVDDFDKALKWSGIEPLYGYHSPDAPQFTPVNQMMTYSIHDPEVKLEDIAMATPVMEHTLPDPPSVKANWMSVEGVAIGNSEPGDTSSQDHIVIQKVPNESLERYLSLLLETVTGDSEDLRRLSLADIQSNLSIASILPDLAQYIDETLGRWSQFTPAQLLKILKLLLSLLKNKSIYLEPYGHCIYPHLRTIVLDSAYLTSEGESDHWHVRQLAAAAMAQLIHRCGSPTNNFTLDLFSAFRYQFSLLNQQNPSSLPALFSILTTLHHLGGLSVTDVLLPHLEPLNRHLQALLNLPKLNVKEDALRVHTTLLELACQLLTSDVYVSSKKLQALSSERHVTSPPYPSATSSSSSSQAHPTQPTDGGFLLASSSFGLGGEKSDLDSSEANLSGVGRRAMLMETPSDAPSLYSFLFEIFGESLGLRLSGHDALKKKRDASAVTQPSSETHTQQPPSNKDIRHVNIIFVQCLSREGFKPVKVDLPYSRPPPQGQWRSWTFHIPRCLVPVKRNVLEHGMGMRHRHQQHHRGRVKTGPSVSYKRRLHKFRYSSDVGSSWL